MKRSLITLVACVLGQNALAMDVSNPEWYACQAGDCLNGRGSVLEHYTGIVYTGTWQGGQTVPGTRYTIQHKNLPGKTFEQTYGSDGLLASGTMLRTITAFGTVGIFTGSFTGIDHPFVRRRVAVPKEGTYDTGNGFEYRGRFDYLPAKEPSSNNSMVYGYFVFYGDKVDTEDGSKETGLFISERAIGGRTLLFSRADPSYLVLLRTNQTRDLAIAQEEIASEESKRKFMMAMKLITDVGMAMQGNKFGGGLTGGRNDFAVGLVSDLIQGKDIGQSVTDLALSKVTKIGGGNKALTDTLIKAVQTGLQEGAGAAR